jgi:hypothetical protein
MFLTTNVGNKVAYLFLSTVIQPLQILCCILRAIQLAMHHTITPLNYQTQKEVKSGQQPHSIGI